MKINCVYFDHYMDLVKEVRRTKEQLESYDIDLENMSFGFVIRGKDVKDLPKQWDDIMEFYDCSEVIWKSFIYDGTLFLVGISYNN